jgi:hypothetical protein
MMHRKFKETMRLDSIGFEKYNFYNSILNEELARAIDSLWTDDDMRVTIPKIYRTGARQEAWAGFGTSFVIPPQLLGDRRPPDLFDCACIYCKDFIRPAETSDRTALDGDPRQFCCMVGAWFRYSPHMALKSSPSSGDRCLVCPALSRDILVLHITTPALFSIETFNSSWLVPVVTHGLPAYNWSTYNLSNHDDLIYAGYVVVFSNRPTE